MLHHEDFFSGHDGLRLYEQVWLPEGEPRAVLVLVHGLAEHSGHYAATAEELTRRRYVLHTMDLRGHGRSEGPRCYIRAFDQYLDDLDVLAGRAVARQPEKPWFLWGHSMGGLIATAWAIVRQPACRGLVLSAPLLRAADPIYPRLRRFAGPLSRIFPRWRAIRVNFGGISRDPQRVAQFQADPLVFHGRFPLRTVAEILRVTRFASEQSAAIRLPLLVLHGAADQLCDPAASRDLSTHAAAGDKTLRLYEGLYHDVLREPEAEQVLADLIAWLDRRC
ncbi:MAG: lysophospholipase [Thermoguttaceae bacterium]|jgi:alpha-beta hydrolase superfamily lysophospholipase